MLRRKIDILFRVEYSCFSNIIETVFLQMYVAFCCCFL